MTNKPLLVAAILFSIASCVSAQTFQCTQNESKSIRNVFLKEDEMTVVNPKTPRIVFKKQTSVEVRGNITKATNDAWEMYTKDGIGYLTNKTFGEKYTCIQFGS